MGVPKIRAYLILGSLVLIIRILLFRVLYLGPLFSETPSSGFRVSPTARDARNACACCEVVSLHVGFHVGHVHHAMSSRQHFRYEDDKKFRMFT